MKVVITGGSGFIGTALVKHFAQTEPDTEVVILDVATPPERLPPNARYIWGDTRNLNCLLDAFRSADEVYHLAGVLGTSELIDVHSLATEINVLGASNVFDAARRCGVARIYNVAKPHFKNWYENTYTITKHAQELIGLMYREKYGMNVATVRWMNAVGPHQHLYPIRKFVPVMALFALYGVNLEIYGSGKQNYDPIDTRDLARFTVHACRNLGNHPDVVDLGNGAEINCNEVVQMILEVTAEEGVKSKSKVVHIPMRPGEVEDTYIRADTSYWDSVGLKPEIPFRESIRAVVKYVMSLPEYHRQNALQFYGKGAYCDQGSGEQERPLKRLG